MLNWQTTRQLHQHSESVAPGCGFLLSCRRRGGERWFSKRCRLLLVYVAFNYPFTAADFLVALFSWDSAFSEQSQCFSEDRSVKESLFGLHGCYIWIAVWEVFTIIYLKVVMPQHIRILERKTAVGSNLVLLHCFYFTASLLLMLAHAQLIGTTPYYRWEG